MKQTIQTIFLWGILLCSLGYGGDSETISNLWPIWNEWEDVLGTSKQQQSAGPLVYKKESEGMKSGGIRPFIVKIEKEEAGTQEWHLLYPLWSYRKSEKDAQWSILSLIRSSRYSGEAAEQRDFDAFPILWYREDPDPNRSYWGVFPLWGTIKNRMGADQIDWRLFPLYSRYENKGEVVYSHLWPFFRRQEGAGSGGFSIWPLYSHRYKEGVYDRQYIFWPFYYNYKEKQDQAVPTRKWGVLPFYASVTAENEKSEHAPWPFYGYVEKQNPEYREDHILWPLWLTVKSEKEKEQRWLPFYSHRIETDPYYEKQWIGWPFFRSEKEVKEGLLVEKQQVLFFLFWNMKQQRIGDPTGPAVKKTHVWPFSSSWNNGNGREQFLFLSPFEVFFPNNTVVREAYSPLFALYRRDVDRHTGRVRNDFLFNAITWEEDEQNQRLEVGPLLQQQSGENGFSLTILHGLFGWSKQEGKRQVHLFWFTL